MNPLELQSDYQLPVKSGDLYKVIFDYSIVPIIVHDMYFNILDVNNTAIDIFGYSKEEFLKMQIFDLHDESELKHSLEVLEKMKETDCMTVETLFKNKEGSVFSAEASPRKINLGAFSFIHVHLQHIRSTKTQ